MANRNIFALRPNVIALKEDPSTINTASADADWKLNGVYSYQGKLYRYVKVVDQATVVGDACIYTATSGSVTTDYTGGTAHLSVVAGVAVSAITVNQHGFILCHGYTASLNVDGSCVAGSMLTTPSAADGRGALIAYTTVDPTEAQLLAGVRHYATASAADATNIAPGFVHCL